jgi:GTPase SAR1 family protein
MHSDSYSGAMMTDSNYSSVIGSSMIETEGGGDANVKFKMMMIGDLSAGKSDMMAKYFQKTPQEVFMSLTEGGIIKEHKLIECCKKNVKIDCLDTT